MYKGAYLPQEEHRLILQAELYLQTVPWCDDDHRHTLAVTPALGIPMFGFTASDLLTFCGWIAPSPIT
jgi:hypothetical protein